MKLNTWRYRNPCQRPFAESVRKRLTPRAVRTRVFCCQTQCPSGFWRDSCYRSHTSTMDHQRHAQLQVAIGQRAPITGWSEHSIDSDHRPSTQTCNVVAPAVDCPKQSPSCGACNRPPIPTNKRRCQRVPRWLLPATLLKKPSANLLSFLKAHGALRGTAQSQGKGGARRSGC